MPPEMKHIEGRSSLVSHESYSEQRFQCPIGQASASAPPGQELFCTRKEFPKATCFMCYSVRELRGWCYAMTGNIEGIQLPQLHWNPESDSDESVRQKGINQMEIRIKGTETSTKVSPIDDKHP